MHERVHKNGLEKPYSWYLVISQAFYKEWVDISMECVAIVNHKRVIYWVINDKKMKYVLEKHLLTWLCGLRVHVAIGWY